MTQCELTCFKAYDIRGEINVNIDEDITYRIGRAVAQAAACGVVDAGVNVLGTGMAGTEEMYWGRD